MSKQVMYEFGPFQLFPGEQQLLQDGRPVPLTFKAFQTLQVLVSNRGRLVDKSELLSAVWPGVVTEEGNLAVTISMIRKALGDTCKQPKYIQTVVKRGYRFIAGRTAGLPSDRRAPESDPVRPVGDSTYTPGLA